MPGIEFSISDMAALTPSAISVTRRFRTPKNFIGPTNKTTGFSRDEYGLGATFEN